MSRRNHIFPRSRHANGRGGAGEPAAGAFTLIEMLVVISLMGILAAIAVPGIRGMTKSNATAAGDRQFLDDLAYARQRAIAGRATVYMVFVPPNLANQSLYPAVSDPALGTVITNLYGGRFTTYALLTLRSVGEQPGQVNPRYLTAWRSLPEGVFIHTNKFWLDLPSAPYHTDPVRREFPTLANEAGTTYLFPLVTNALPPALQNIRLPYIAFDFRGQLVTGQDEYIPMARGSVYCPRIKNGAYVAAPADPRESPTNETFYAVSYPNNAYNQIHIDWLTGRARVEKPELQ